MKKILFGFCALIVGIMIASCNKSSESADDDTLSVSGVSYFESLAKDIEKNGDEWDTEKWISVMKEASEKELAFWESDPSEKEVDEFDEACEEAADAIRNLDSKALKKVKKAASKKEVEKIIEKSKKAEKKVRKKINKDDDSSSYDDDDDY